MTMHSTANQDPGAKPSVDERIVTFRYRIGQAWDNRSMVPEHVARRRAIAAAGAAVLVALGVGAGYKAGYDRGEQDMGRNVLVTGHREVKLGITAGDADNNPATADTTLRTLSDVANAANVPGQNYADTLQSLVDQIPSGKSAGALPVGATFELPASARIGNPVADSTHVDERPFNPYTSD